MNEAYTLFELNNYVREAIENGLPDEYWVEGELAEGRAGYNGHFYGELVQKDDRSQSLIAKARITCWANVYRKLALRFEQETGETLHAGLKVMLLVQVCFHEQFGYSLNILDVNPSYTLGEMAQRRKQILRQLELDGILDDNKQLELPILIQRIAVISSASAAGYGDFCDQLLNNEYGFHFKVQLFPALMQGNRVEESVVDALMQIAEESPEWDAVVIIRGGGATSDLSDFDSYAIAACISQHPLPVITGIGHDRDETVLDFVAHTHLKTPTAVAAFLLDRMCDAASTLDELETRVIRSASDRLHMEKVRLERFSTVIPLLFHKFRDNEEHRILRLQQRLTSSISRFTQQRLSALDMLNQRLSLYGRHRLDTALHKLEMIEQRVRGLDPDLLLKRGYSITMVNGKLLRGVDNLKPGDEITTRLECGEVISVVEKTKKNS